MDIENLWFLEYLHLRSESVERITLKSLYALKALVLNITNLKNNFQRDFFKQMPNIEILTIKSDYLKLNFRKLEKKLSIHMFRVDVHTFSSMSLIFNQIEKLSVKCCSDTHKLSKLLSFCDNLRNLLELDISDCEITKIPKSMFNGLDNLRSLSLNNNKTQMIYSDAFSNLKQLIHLDLSCNYLESIDKDTFSELVNLESLNLSENRLESLDENIFLNLKNLRQLNLGFNQLFLEPKLFFGLENLYELNLTCTGLIHFDLRILNYLPDLKKIDLSRNLFKQDSKTEIIVHRFKEDGIEFIYNGY